MPRGAWAWIGAGLVLGAVAGWAAGNLPAGFGVGAALGVTFAWATRVRRDSPPSSRPWARGEEGGGQACAP